MTTIEDRSYEIWELITVIMAKLADGRWIIEDDFTKKSIPMRYFTKIILLLHYLGSWEVMRSK